MEKRLEYLEFRVLQENDTFYPQWKNKKRKNWHFYYHTLYSYRISMDSLITAREVIIKSKKQIKPTIIIHKAEK